MLKTQKIFKSERHNGFTEVINQIDLSSLKEVQNFFIQVFKRYKVCLFSI